MMFLDATGTPVRMANHILAQEAWAREKLTPFAGRVFTLTIGPLAARFLITAEGMLDRAPHDMPADLRLVLSPRSVPAFLANPSRWNEFVREEGDVALGGACKELARTLPWFVEATLAKGLGPVAGQRVADAGRRMLAFPEYAAASVAEGVASFTRDESGLLAPAASMRAFSEGVSDTVARVDGLAQRFEVLAARARVSATLVSGAATAKS